MSDLLPCYSILEKQTPQYVLISKSKGTPPVYLPLEEKSGPMRPMVPAAQYVNQDRLLVVSFPCQPDTA